MVKMYAAPSWKAERQSVPTLSADFELYTPTAKKPASEPPSPSASPAEVVHEDVPAAAAAAAPSSSAAASAAPEAAPETPASRGSAGPIFPHLDRREQELRGSPAS